MIKKNLQLVLALLLIIELSSSKQWKNRKFVKVKTECGKVEGKSFRETTDTGKRKTVYEFRNIPYAVPPVGNLRWKPPVRLSKDKSKCWKKTLRYDKKKIVACKQSHPREPNLISSEDCLVITVRTPTLNKNAKLPVFFWIHGGGLVWGYNEMPTYFPKNEKPSTNYPNREFTASMNAVTVSVNYRLNFFGFLSLKELWINSGPEESYGNYGIMDQILALKWVQHNIQNFGGDPNKVTIFGDSGGAVAVYGLIASPLANGLFQKASPLSGAPNYRVTHTMANQILRPFLAQTPCHGSDEQVANCLRSLPGEVFLAVSKGDPERTSNPTLTFHFQFPRNTPYVGFPVEVLDPVVVPHSPDQIPLTRGDYLDILIGQSAQEVAPSPTSASFLDRNITDFASLENEIKPRLDTFKMDSYSLMLSLYTQNCDGSINMPDQVTAQYIYTLMTTDVLVSCTTANVAKYLSQLPNFSVFRYVISQPDSKGLGLGVNAANHGWGPRLLFGLRKIAGRAIPKADRRLMMNIRYVYKRFIHSDPWFKQIYKDKVIDFWRNYIFRLNGYHEQQCNAWQLTGVLGHSWGLLGISE